MANDFTTDPSVKALWRFESGALATDSIGGNTLTLYNSPVADTSKFKEGAASLKLVHSSSQCAYIPDASLPSGFPLKSGDSVMKMTVSLWIYQNSIGSYLSPFSKFDYGNNLRTFDIEFLNGSLIVNWGNGSSFQAFTPGWTLATGQWYHVTVCVDGVNNILKIVLYNPVTGAYSFYAATPTTAMGCGTASLNVGVSGTMPSATGGNYWDGWIDEMVVFNRLLNLGEIENIINQVYTGPYAAASPGNVFTGDARFQAVWKFEAGALTTDSGPIGTNTLSSYNTLPVADSFGVEEGASAANFNNYQALQIADASLSANFPLKSGDAVKKITVCGWVIPAVWGGSYPVRIWKKDDNLGSGVAALIASNGHLQIQVGNFVATPYDTGFVLGLYKAYHIAIVLDGVNGTCVVRVYDAAAGTVSDYSTSISTISVGTGAFYLGVNSDSGVYFQGWMDDVVVANALLSDAEIDEIRAQTYRLASTWNFTSAAAILSGTSTPGLNVLRALTSGAAMVSGVGSPALAMLRELQSAAAIESGVSSPGLTVVRPLVSAAAMQGQVSTPSLTVQRALASLAAILSETSDIHIDGLGIFFTSVAAILSGTSTPALTVVRPLVSAAPMATETPAVSLAVLRPLVSVAAMQSETSLVTLLKQIGLMSAAAIKTATSTAALNVLRRLMSVAAATSRTSSPTLQIEGGGGAIVPPPPIHAGFVTLASLLAEAHRLPQAPTLAELLDEAHKTAVKSND